MTRTLTRTPRAANPAAGDDVEGDVREGAEQVGEETSLAKLERAVPRLRLPVWLRAGAPTWIWIGVLVAGVGFVLIFVAWGQMAGETEVFRQLPYLTSAGLTGLGLVMVGVTTVNVATRHRDGIARDRQLARLTSVMEESQRGLAEPPARRR